MRKAVSCRGRRPDRRGLTLVELMVVVGLIALVMALLIPAVQLARKSATRTHCAHNLHNTAAAYQNWKDANPHKLFPTESWVSTLCPYTENTKAMFNCPLDTASYELKDPVIYLRFFWNSRSNPLVFYELNSSNILQITKSGNRCRLSTQHWPPAGSPDGSWVADLEITWNSNATGIIQVADWNDLYMLLEPQQNNSTKITFYRGDAVHGGVGLAGIMDILDQNQNAVATSVQIGQFAYIPDNGRGISYGMNSRAHNIESDVSTKILLVEYTDSVANVVPPAPFNKDLALYPTKVQPRHAGMLNVLFADGHIKTLAPSEIDPRDAGIASAMWVP